MSGLKPYQATPGAIVDSDNLAEDTVSLHYDKWDTLEMEESDIPERIEENNQYILLKVPVDARVDWYSPYDFDEGDSEEIRDRIVDTGAYPPIVLDADMDIIDGWHRAYAVFELLKQPFIWGWVPYDGEHPRYEP
jgi:hypothetical protein